MTTALCALRPRPVRILTTCPDCSGAGEVATHQDYWGNWETEPCRLCRGSGDLDALDAERERAARCEHGVHEDDDRGCPACTATRRAASPWADLTPVGGWDQEPPF